MISRQVVEGELAQGEDEQIVYTVDTTPWGGTPTAVAVVVKDTSNNYLDVTATVMPSGSPSVVLNVISLPKLKLLTKPHVYRVEVKFDTGGSTFEAYFLVAAER